MNFSTEVKQKLLSIIEEMEILYLLCQDGGTFENSFLCCR